MQLIKCGTLIYINILNFNKICQQKYISNEKNIHGRDIYQCYGQLRNKR